MQCHKCESLGTQCEGCSSDFGAVASGPIFTGNAAQAYPKPFVALGRVPMSPTKVSSPSSSARPIAIPAALASPAMIKAVTQTPAVKAQAAQAAGMIAAKSGVTAVELKPNVLGAIKAQQKAETDAIAEAQKAIDFATGKRHVALGRVPLPPAAPAASYSTRPMSPIAARRVSTVETKPTFTIPQNTGMVVPDAAPISSGGVIYPDDALEQAAQALNSQSADYAASADLSTIAPPPAEEEATAFEIPKTMRTAMAKAPSTALAIVPPAPVSAPKPSLWKRILTFLGIMKETPSVSLAALNGESDMQGTAASVVRRARNGDQNAMALIALVRDNAAKGVPQALKSYEEMRRYIASNPVDTMHGEVQTCDTCNHAIKLANGPLLTNNRVRGFLSRFHGEAQKAIVHGITHKSRALESSANPDINAAIRMGKILGEARRLQAVRMPYSSLSRFNPRVGWELGE